MTPSSSLVRVVACLNASLLAASALHCEAAETPDRPIHVLFLGDSTPANPGTQPGTYAFLPGQTLAGEAIYFDHSSANTALTPAYLAHFDAVLVVGDEALSAAQKKALEDFAAKGRGVKTLPASARTDDARLRSAALDGVGATVRKEWEGFVAGRAPLKYGGNAHVANYEKRPAPLPLQEPLSARESMKYTQVPADFDLRLFASDPDIFKPIAMAWDERGRLWVAETRDYPNEVRPAGEGNDDIKICEDTDGDGKADKFTVFADRLNIPTSIVFTNGGLLVAQAPHFLFLKDTNGDDKADVRQLLFENAWAVNDTHAGPSSLHWGFDNWLYGSVGYDGFKSRSGPEKSFRQGIFRFRPDGSAIEFLHQFSNNTWGFGYNDAGDLFGSTANNAPSFFCGLPLTHFASGQRLMSAKRINTYDKVHPNTANIRQVDVMGGYTAAAGHMFMNSGALPERLRGKALVTEPTCKLINVFDIRPDGAGFKALDAYNLLASSDEYMSPVAAEVGPDGAVWVADWYNFIIQHNPTPSPERGGYKAENGKGGAHVNPNRDTSHGRIYRVVWKDGAASAIRSLKNASEADLVGALGSDNQFWRLTAQRLLVDGKKTGAIPALKALAATAQGVGAIHALWTLHGINALDTETHRAALLSKDPAVRRNAVRALPPSAASLYFSTGIVNDADLTTRLAALVKLAELPTTPELQTVVARLRKEPLNTQDEWLADATKMLVQKHHIRGAYVEGPNLLPNPDFEQEAKNLPAGWMVRHYDGKARQQIAGKLEARNGDHSLRLEGLPGEGADTSLFAVAVVKPRTDYKLSAWIKTKGVRGATGALLNVHSTPFQTEPVKGDSDWVQVETRFNSGDAKSVSVNCLLGGFGKSTGVAWFDDISLNELTPEADQPVRIVADAKRGEQIFRSHPLALCAQCHAVGGAGGNVGPALDGLASRKDEAYILESLVEPNAKMAEGFAGQVSPMPPMALILKEQEIADVKAYLLTLKAK